MKLRNIVIVVYLILSAAIFITFQANITVWLSFFANWVLLTSIFLYHIKIERHYSPFLSSYITFNYLFFLLAPMVQIKALDGEKALFPNFIPYTDNSTIYANFLIFIFHAVFFSVYVHFKEKVTKKDLKDNYESSKFLPLNILILLIVSCITLVLSYDFLSTSLAESHWRSELKHDLSVSSQLILKKVLYIIPLGALVLSHHYLNKKRRQNNNTIILLLCAIILFCLLIFFKNPLTEKRNAIGPIYITLLFLFYPRLFNSNVKTFVFLFFSLVILFPLVSSLTHLDASLEDIIKNPGLVLEKYGESNISETFNSLHYDAFANVVATIDYTIYNGLSYGYQLLSGLLFFVPRSLWVTKSKSSGEFIGDYLIDNHGFFYNNLSNPMVSEGYINFGVLGICILAGSLAYFIVKFLIWLNSKNPLKKIIAFYFSVHLIFLLRGDFTNGFSYFVGTFIGVLLIPSSLDLFLKWAFKKTIKT